MDDHNPDYPLSVVNPFATLATVPRVPQVNPEPTMAFRMYDELQISLQNNEKLMIFGNHANSRHPLYYFKGTDADPVISALTRDFVAYAALDAQLNKVSYLNSSLTGAEIKAAC